MTEADRATHPTPWWHEYKWRAAAAVGLNYFCFLLVFTVVLVVLTPIAEEFDVTLRTVGWVVIIESLIIVALLLPTGALADRVGHKRMAVAGTAIFGVGVLITALAPSFAVLMVGRVVSALGNTCVQATLTGILVSSFPSHERGLAFAAQTSSVALGSAVGPLLAGVGLEFVDWNVLFLIMLAPVFLSGFALQRLLRDDHGSSPHPKRSFDVPGSVLGALVTTLLVVLVSNPFKFSWTSWQVLVGSLVLIVAATAFVRVELASSVPMIELRWFTNRAFSRAVAIRFFGFGASAAVVLLLPIYLLSARQAGETKTGLVLFFGALGLGTSAQVAGRLYDRFGPRWPAITGLAAQATALLVFATADASTPLVLLVLLNAGTGFAQGLWNVPANSTILGETPSDAFGRAGALTHMNRTLGTVLGQALATAVVGALMAARGFDVPLADVEDSPAAAGAFLDGWSVAFAISAGVTLAMVPIAWRLPRPNAGVARST